MAHDAFDPRFRSLIDEHAPVRQLGSGFSFIEGPIWHPTDHYLLFSDMPGDVRRRWDSAGVREVERPSRKGNGMTYDSDLNLLVCEHTTSSVVRVTPGGERTVLASHFEGCELNSPNDLVVHSSGAVYFTDPWYGRMPSFGIERPRELGFQGVYRIPPGGGAPQLLVDRFLFGQPNGLCFCPGEDRLYVNDTEQENIRVFQLQKDGSLSDHRVFASGIKDSLKPGVPDGMKCDRDGNIWVTGPGGVWVYGQDGRHIGIVSVPEVVANLHWGGPDWQTLFLAASTSLYAVQIKTGPRREPFMTPKGAVSPSSESSIPQPSGLDLDASRCALIIQDMQNDVVMNGGAFASSGAPVHCREQNAIGNLAQLAEACRAEGVPVIHVWFVVEPGAPGLTLNAPLFEGLVHANAVVRGTWGAEPVPGLEPHPGDHVLTKVRMSAWEGTPLETILKATGRDTVIVAGAWTNMSIEHTARTGADKGYVMIVPEDCCATMNADWHRASIEYAMKNVSTVTASPNIIHAIGQRRE